MVAPSFAAIDFMHRNGQRDTEIDGTSTCEYHELIRMDTLVQENQDRSDRYETSAHTHTHHHPHPHASPPTIDEKKKEAKPFIHTEASTASDVACTITS